MMLLQGYLIITMLAEFEAKIKPLTGVHLTIAAIHEPPIFSIFRDPTNQSIVHYAGFPKDTFDLLANSLNFTFSFVEVPSSVVKEMGSLDNAMLDQLLKKKADFNWRLTTPTAERLALTDFTVPITVLHFAFIQPMPQLKHRYLAPIKPYQPVVWFLILVAFVSIVVVLTMTNKTTKLAGCNRERTVPQAISQSSMFAFEVLMAQGGGLPSNRLSLRFVAGAWCLVSIVIVYAYNSTLISYISLPKYESVVDTWEDLAASKTLRISAARGSFFANTILNAKTAGVMKILGDSFRRNPGDLPLTLAGELDRIMQSGCCAYVEAKKLLEILVYRSMTVNGGECKLTLGKDLDYTQVWSFSVRKNLQHLPIIDKEIQRLRQNGLLTRLGKTYTKSIDKCLARQIDRPKNSKLTLYDLASAFIVLGFGSFLSINFFIAELILASRRPRIRYKEPIIIQEITA